MAEGPRGADVSRAEPHPPRHVAMVCATTSSVDGILDYAHGLGLALATLHGLDVDVVVRRAGTWSIRRMGRPEDRGRPAHALHEALEHADALILHYNPFVWGRRGFAPDLVRQLAALRRRARRPVIGVLAHERYVDMRGVRWTVMGAWQRVQFLAVVRLADVAWSSTETWTKALRRQTPAHVAQMPICSNLPDRRVARASSRERLGADDSTVVLAAFGTNHPARLMGHAERAAAAVAGLGRPVTLLNLGADPPAVSVEGAAIRVLAPGRLDATSLAEHLAAADLYLAPFSDGVSGRRTTLMAALQHALPVVGTDGPSTDTILRDARDALRLTPAADGDAFARAARELASDPGRRASGAAARRLYETHFDWPIACRAALAALEGRR